MTVSTTASMIYKTAKKAATGDWAWRLEWSKAMKMAWRKVMSKTKCTPEIWNSAASLHTRGLSGLKEIIQTVGHRIGAKDGQEVMNHLYDDFLTRKESGETEGKGGYYTFGFYLNIWHDKKNK